MFDPGNEPEDIFAEIEKDTPSLNAASDKQRQPLVATSFGPRRWPFVVGVLVFLGVLGGGVWLVFLRKPTVIGDTNGDVSQGFNDSSVSGTSSTGKVESTPKQSPSTQESSVSENEALQPIFEEPISEPEPEAPIVPPDEPIAPSDADNDGLVDTDERTYGTNPLVADTDNDGLSDGDEVHTYKTDPTNPDTDGDTYLDGQEVQGGYNPNGPGKL